MWSILKVASTLGLYAKEILKDHLKTKGVNFSIATFLLSRHQPAVILQNHEKMCIKMK